MASVPSTGQIADPNVDLRTARVLCEPFNKLTLSVRCSELSAHSGSSKCNSLAAPVEQWKADVLPSLNPLLNSKC